MSYQIITVTIAIKLLKQIIIIRIASLRLLKHPSFPSWHLSFLQYFLPFFPLCPLSLLSYSQFYSLFFQMKNIEKQIYRYISHENTNIYKIFVPTYGYINLPLCNFCFFNLISLEILKNIC